MKIKTYFLMCLLLGMTTNQLSAQWPAPPDNNNGTGAIVVQRTYQFDETNIFYFWDDAPLALTSLSGATYWHIEYHFVNSTPEYAKYQMHGELTSNNTGEVFELSEIGTDYDNMGYSKLNLNFRGNLGSHYIIAATTVWGGLFTIDKFISIEN